MEEFEKHEKIFEKKISAEITRIFEFVKKEDLTKNHEFEIRIGSFNDKDLTFNSSIGQWWWDNLITQVKSSFPLKFEPQWERFIDVMFRDGKRIRIKDEKYGTCIKKILIRGTDLKLKQSNYDVRIRLNYESPIVVSQSEIPEYFIIQERLSLFEKDTPVIWDFSVTWGGRTKLEAMNSPKPQFKVEAEYYLSNSDFDIENLIKIMTERTKMMIKPDKNYRQDKKRNVTICDLTQTKRRKTD